jgi:hypothetical protein
MTERHDRDGEVRSAVYRHLVETSAAPSVSDIERHLGMTRPEILAAYQRLFARRVLVVGADGETIVMAPPFSGVPTQHRVAVGNREYFANCAWDALGIPAALHAPAIVRSRCEQSGEPLTILVDRDGPAPEPCVAHFAVPAALWWRDIGFT